MFENAAHYFSNNILLSGLESDVSDYVSHAVSLHINLHCLKCFTYTLVTGNYFKNIN